MSYNLADYYSTFLLKSPFINGAYKQGGRKRKRKQRGGMITRFGSTLSGNPNPKVFRGCPTGGMEDKYLPKSQDPWLIGSGRRKRRRMHHGGSRIRADMLMDNFINPNTLHHNTFPTPGTTIYY